MERGDIRSLAAALSNRSHYEKCNQPVIPLAKVIPQGLYPATAPFFDPETGMPFFLFKTLSLDFEQTE